MYMHNQVAEKLIGTLLRKGYSLRVTVESKKAYKDAIETKLNCCILGSDNSQSTYQIPMTKDGKNISGKISFSDGKAKKIMSDIGALVSDTFNEGKYMYVSLAITLPMSYQFNTRLTLHHPRLHIINQ